MILSYSGEQLHQSEEQETKPKKSAILSVIEGHSHRYTRKTVQLDLPTPLTSLYQSSRLVLDLPALLEEGAKVFDELNLTPEQFSTEATRPITFHMDPDGSESPCGFKFQWMQLLLAFGECWYFQLCIIQSHSVFHIEASISKNNIFWG
ncbi:hypothetical protein KUCAC02_023824 [Chaenocephalus aceratus]|uniref:Uncharacterized protein n=1 Tax=Chaenocephalus aceratus TaxID=36190 RepID=A0ACB9WG29_CHAAC|nr:hypothetical protein KUCAC02_023824 [Chaenocephalus aceratus]